MSYEEEKENISKCLKKLLNIEFEIINSPRDIENLPPSFSSIKSISDDLVGNPLQIEYIANLNQTYSDNPKMFIKMPLYTSAFNVHCIQPSLLGSFNQSYKKILKLFQNRNKSESVDFQNVAVLLLGDTFKMRGYAKHDNESLYYLKVDRQNIEMNKDNQKLRISEILQEPRYKNSLKYVDVNYLFKNGEFSVKRHNSYNVFDWPEPTAECVVTIETDPFNEDNKLYNIKAELEQLKILYQACEEDCSKWESYQPEFVINYDYEFKERLEKYLTETDTIGVDPSTGMHYMRAMDISETLWTILRNINNKKLFKQCTLVLLPTLQANFSRVKFGNSNPTEFHRMLCDRFLKSESLKHTFLANTELLVEVGLYKITSDLLYIIMSELPSITQQEQSKLMNVCCKVENLKMGIDSLDHLFNALCYMETLKQCLVPNEFRNQSTLMIRSLISSHDRQLSPTLTFDVKQSFKTSVSLIQTNLMSFCSFWAAHFITEFPVKSHKVVVFEIENNTKNFDTYRHDIELSEIKVYS